MRYTLVAVLTLAIGTSPLLAQTELVDVSPSGRRCRNADFPKDLPKAADLADLDLLISELAPITAPKGTKVTVTAYYRDTGIFGDAVVVASSLESEETESIRTAVTATLLDSDEPGPWAARLQMEWKGDKIEVKSERPRLCSPAPIRGDDSPGASRRGSRGPQGASTSRRQRRPSRQRMVAEITVTATGEVTKAELISGPSSLNKDDFERMWEGRRLQPALLDGRAIPYVWRLR